MPTVSDHININEPILHRLGPKDRIDPNSPVPHVATLDISWAVLDLTTDQVSTFPSEGGHFASRGQRFLIFARATDVHGVQFMSQDGAGVFRCATDQDLDRERRSFELPTAVPVSLPHHEFKAVSAAPTLQSLVVTMNPDIGAFDYFKLSAGFRQLLGMPSSLEFTAFAGTMTFTATAISSRGDRITGSLTTSP
jgi:hypothetical protein